MKKNKKIVFYTLLGFVLGAVVVTSIFIISSDSKKQDGTPDTDEPIVYGENITRYEENSNEVIVKEEKINVVSTQNSNIATSNISEAELSSEDKIVIEYLEEKYQEVNSKPVKEKVKDIFKTTVDFLFYDGQIKGKTLKELTNKGKTEATKLITKIEISIENKFPGLIDETKDIYKDKKEKIIEKYYETVENICKDRQDVCNEFKRDYEEMKQSYKDTFKYLLDLGEKGLDKTKETFTNWYNNLKK